MSVRALLLCLAALALATPAPAQIIFLPLPRKARPADPGVLPGPPPDLPAAEAAIWPFPPPDPKSWWEDKRPKPPEAADPLGGRRVRRGEQLPQPANNVAPSTYRLWGLMPLQWQVLRDDEMILEVWTRPTDTVRQTVTRITVRRDEKAFVQARAGLACCEALIGRRMGFDAELPEGSAAQFRALAQSPAWTSPRDVLVAYAGAAEAVCVEGTGYDLTLVARDWSRTLHRACDPAEIGEVADILQAVVGAALGHDARFDVLFPGGADFSKARAAYRDLVAEGGRLKPNPEARTQPPGDEPAPQPEPEAPPGAPQSSPAPPPSPSP